MYCFALENSSILIPKLYLVLIHLPSSDLCLSIFFTTLRWITNIFAFHNHHTYTQYTAFTGSNSLSLSLLSRRKKKPATKSPLSPCLFLSFTFFLTQLLNLSIAFTPHPSYCFSAHSPPNTQPMHIYIYVEHRVTDNQEVVKVQLIHITISKVQVYFWSLCLVQSDCEWEREICREKENE